MARIENRARARSSLGPSFPRRPTTRHTSPARRAPRDVFPSRARRSRAFPRAPRAPPAPSPALARFPAPLRASRRAVSASALDARELGAGEERARRRSRARRRRAAVRRVGRRRHPPALRLLRGDGGGLGGRGRVGLGARGRLRGGDAAPPHPRRGVAEGPRVRHLPRPRRGGVRRRLPPHAPPRRGPREDLPRPTCGRLRVHGPRGPLPAPRRGALERPHAPARRRSGRHQRTLPAPPRRRREPRAVRGCGGRAPSEDRVAPGRARRRVRRGGVSESAHARAGGRQRRVRRVQGGGVRATRRRQGVVRKTARGEAEDAEV